MQEFTPDEFLFSFQPALWVPIELRWVDDHFELDGLEAGTVAKSPPDVQAWVRFWRKVEKLGMWDWQPAYDNFEILDGLSWELSIRYHGRVIHTQGSNAYPGDSSLPGEYTPTFVRFLAAIRALARLDKRVFR